MSDDIISRQAAIDAIEQHKTAVLEGREWDEGIAYGYAAAHRHLVEIVKQLPSAERRGWWIDIEQAPDYLFYATCSVCGNRQTIGVSNYCPMCGARLEVSE